MSAQAVAGYIEEYERSGREAIPRWLADRRQAGIEAFRAAGFPTLRHEDWKYTDLRSLAGRRYRLATPEEIVVPAGSVDALRFPELKAREVVFVEGRLQSGAGSLRQAIQESAPGVEQHLARQKEAVNPFVDLNTALMSDGAYVHVGDDAQESTVIHLVFLGGAGKGETASYPRNLIVLGRNARATVIEHYRGADDRKYFTDAVTEVVLGPGAVLEHYKLQEEGREATHIATLYATLDRDSRLESHSISLGAALGRNDIRVRLAAPGAEALLNGLYVAGGRQHVDNHTRIDHEQPRTKSLEAYRGVVDGRARAVFNGKVVVHQDAQKSDAQQSNANLLLSDDAEVDTKPELEIYADDVKCGHGATVGRLDQNQLFYLRSRAIPEAVARSLLTFAFADDVMGRIRLKPVRARLEQGVAARLPDAELIREFM